MIIFALLASTACAANVDAKVTPVQKVIELMEGMIAKGKKEKHLEQVQYAAYKQWCDDTQREKQAAIEEANEMIEVLKADIQKYSADRVARKRDCQARGRHYGLEWRQGSGD